MQVWYKDANEGTNKLQRLFDRLHLGAGIRELPQSGARRRPSARVRRPPPPRRCFGLLTSPPRHAHHAAQPASASKPVDQARPPWQAAHGPGQWRRPSHNSWVAVMFSRRAVGSSRISPRAGRIPRPFATGHTGTLAAAAHWHITRPRPRRKKQRGRETLHGRVRGETRPGRG